MANQYRLHGPEGKISERKPARPRRVILASAFEGVV
jgi:hypothetical protein